MLGSKHTPTSPPLEKGRNPSGGCRQWCFKLDRLLPLFRGRSGGAILPDPCFRFLLTIREVIPAKAGIHLEMPPQPRGSWKGHRDLAARDESRDGSWIKSGMTSWVGRGRWVGCGICLWVREFVYPTSFLPRA